VLDELIDVAGAQAMPAGLGPSAPVLHTSLFWLGGALGACLWQAGWAARVGSSRAIRRCDLGRATLLWLIATAVWVWLLFPAGRHPGDPVWVVIAVVIAALLPLSERILFSQGKSPWPGAVLRFAWWGVFVA